jgi:flagellar biosynthesis/type III secretory pathway chaperone
MFQKIQNLMQNLRQFQQIHCRNRRRLRRQFHRCQRYMDLHKIRHRHRQPNIKMNH